MAANANVIVFDASDSDNTPISSPVKKPSVVKPNTSSDSDSDLEPIVKKKRATQRHVITNRPPLGDIQNEDLPNVAVYTKSVPSLFTMSTTLMPPELDADDIEEEEKVLKLTKKTRSKKSSGGRTAPAQKPAVCLIEDDEDIAGSAMAEVPRDRSPTPPPCTPTEVYRRRRRRKPRTPKDTTQAIGNLEVLRGRLQRDKTFGFDQVVDDDSDDVIIVDDHATPESPQKGLTVKIRSVRGIQRFQMKHSESFEGVLKKIADEEDVEMNQVVVFHKDHTVEPYDTPRALKLTVADILSCHIVRREASTDDEEGDEDGIFDDLDDPSMVSLKIQGKNSRAATVTIRIKRTDPLDKLMREYASKCGLNHEKLTFTFDGDVVKRSQTADSLDMEDDDCLDVTGS